MGNPEWHTWAVKTFTNDLIDLATSNGATVAGVTTAAPFEQSRQAIQGMISRGAAGRLRFVFDDPKTATDVTMTFPWARSLLVIGYDYLPTTSAPAATGVVVGRFATSDQYQIVSKVARAVSNRIRQEGGRAETLLDDNRLVDRSAAIRAGLGWKGRSTMVLVPGHGPWMLFGSVVTDLVLEPSQMMRRDCGTCVACQPACPTAAITDDGLDATRCISAILQTPGSIPHWIRPLIGRRVYGCDDCLIACPPGIRSLESVQRPKSELPFDTLLGLTDDELAEMFSWWYIPRRDGRYVRRNLIVAAGNSREKAARPSIEDHLTHKSSMIRGHATWAYARSMGKGAIGKLSRAQRTESVPEAIEELRLAMLMLESPEAYARETR